MVARGAKRDLGKIANIVGMAGHAADTWNRESMGPPGAPQARTIAAATDWDIAEYTCHCGPADRTFEEQHGHFTIAAVMQGHFTYKTDNGRGLMQPGALLLGNQGKCFECGHEHGVGDRCIALHIAPQLFDEIGASVTGALNYKFRRAALPPMPGLLPQVAKIETLASQGDALLIGQSVPTLVASILAAASGQQPTRRAATARDERRVGRVLSYLQAHATKESLGLDELADVATMSKYHFLRTFQQTVGVTPHQYLLNLRLRGAAVRLATTTEPVTKVALDNGFGDLSTFNGRFRRMFGTHPRAYRARGG